MLDCPLSVAEGLKSHLKLYKLRSKVKIKDATSLYDVLVSGVHDPWQASSTDGPKRDDLSLPAETPGQPDGASTTLARFVDPRCAALGVRSIRPKGDAGAFPCVVVRAGHDRGTRTLSLFFISPSFRW